MICNAVQYAPAEMGTFQPVSLKASCIKGPSSIYIIDESFVSDRIVHIPSGRKPSIDSAVLTCIPCYSARCSIHCRRRQYCAVFCQVDSVPVSKQILCSYSKRCYTPIRCNIERVGPLDWMECKKAKLETCTRVDRES